VADESVYRHAPDVVLRRIGEEGVLVPVKNNVGDLDSIFTLNQSAITIWETLDGTTALHRVIDRVCTEYEVDRDTAAADAGELITRLAEAGLIEEAD
jgi:Coenzyme PQQ synthesis protein D (PqqD)